MKTLLISILIPMSILLGRAEQLIAQTETILLEVEFGIKSKKQCKSGYGICSLTPIKRYSGKPLKGYRAVATATVIDGTIVALEFHENSMHQGTLKKYFSTKTFLFDIKSEIRVPQKGFLLEVSGYKYQLKKSKNEFLLEVSG